MERYIICNDRICQDEIKDEAFQEDLNIKFDSCLLEVFDGNCKRSNLFQVQSVDLIPGEPYSMMYLVTWSKYEHGDPNEWELFTWNEAGLLEAIAWINQQQGR